MRELPCVRQQVLREQGEQHSSTHKHQCAVCGLDIQVHPYRSFHREDTRQSRRHNHTLSCHFQQRPD